MHYWTMNVILDWLGLVSTISSKNVPVNRKINRMSKLPLVQTLYQPTDTQTQLISTRRQWITMRWKPRTICCYESNWGEPFPIQALLLLRDTNYIQTLIARRKNCKHRRDSNSIEVRTVIQLDGIDFLPVHTSYSLHLRMGHIRPPFVHLKSTLKALHARSNDPPDERCI